MYRELLKEIFSRTTRPISTKLGRKHAWEMGIQICSNKGADPFWGLVRGKIRNILPECIDVYHGSSLGQEDSILFK